MYKWIIRLWVCLVCKGHRAAGLRGHRGPEVALGGPSAPSSLMRWSQPQHERVGVNWGNRGKKSHVFQFQICRRHIPTLCNKSKKSRSSIKNWEKPVPVIRWEAFSSSCQSNQNLNASLFPIIKMTFGVALVRYIFQAAEGQCSDLAGVRAKPKSVRDSKQTGSHQVHWGLFMTAGGQEMVMMMMKMSVGYWRVSFTWADCCLC